MPADRPSILIAWALLVLVVLIGAWDIYAYSSQGKFLTVSSVLNNWSHDHPIIAFAFGVLAGHIFWRR